MKVSGEGELIAMKYCAATKILEWCLIDLHLKSIVFSEQSLNWSIKCCF